jgi:hypothetical protein
MVLAEDDDFFHHLMPAFGSQTEEDDAGREHGAAVPLFPGHGVPAGSKAALGKNSQVAAGDVEDVEVHSRRMRQREVHAPSAGPKRV